MFGFTSGTLTIAPPSDWDLLPRTGRQRNEAGPSRPAPVKEEVEEVVVISSDDSLPDVAEGTRDTTESTRSSAQMDDMMVDVSGDTLHVPLEHQHDRLRRVIRHPSSSYSFVSMRSQVEQFEVEPSGSFRLSPSRHLKTNTRREGIDDACLLSNGADSMIITGHVQDAKQISAMMIDSSSASLSSISHRIEGLMNIYPSPSPRRNSNAH
ncbi:hypothetical protein BDZ89DRAFT_1048079 [Hymenopellis radicata]|nr:hypothetical protein BDZ89DRAFT_1048079 [Hymenopellis radicata]